MVRLAISMTEVRYTHTHVRVRARASTARTRGDRRCSSPGDRRLARFPRTRGSRRGLQRRHGASGQETCARGVDPRPVLQGAGASTLSPAIRRRATTRAHGATSTAKPGKDCCRRLLHHHPSRQPQGSTGTRHSAPPRARTRTQICRQPFSHSHSDISAPGIAIIAILQYSLSGKAANPVCTYTGTRVVRVRASKALVLPVKLLERK